MFSFFDIFRKKPQPDPAFSYRMERSINQFREMYAAAKTFRLTGTWSPSNANVNSIIKLSSPTVRARIRQLVRDFPYFSRAAQVLSDFVVGDGIRFQSRIANADGTLNQSLIQETEDAFSFWADEADISLKLHYYELMQLVYRQLVECGEYILVKHYPRDTYIPYALQPIEPDYLGGNEMSRGKMSAASEIEQGIEYNKTTGRVIAYHFSDPDGWGTVRRVPADDVIHGFRTMRPGQLRGISDFAPGVLVANDLQDYMDAEIDGAKMAAKWLAFVTREGPVSGGGFPGVTQDDDGKTIEELENGIIEYLQAGERIELAKNPRPGNTFEPFVNLILTMFSVATGVPYPLVSGRYEGMNYNTLRAVRNDFKQVLKPKQSFMIRQYCRPTTTGFFDAAYYSGKLNYPGYLVDPMPYLRSQWQPPGMESVDPLKEAKAKAEEMKTLTRSPQETVLERGRDWEEVLKEINAAVELAESYNLEYDPMQSNTSMQTNPAALDDDLGDE
jgi:lambda family phage portal protein